MSSFLDEVSDQLNLRWAWEKVQKQATPGDNWFDEVELAAFDLELEKNLQSIAAEFLKGRYRLAPLRPLPFPKHPDEEGKPRIRQMFQVAVRDQVAWTAVVNVIGPHVDGKMPVWSYGNRLFRSIWVEEDEHGLKHRRIGRYRHASGRLYLPFRQAWPVFRRHVYLATQAMAKPRKRPEMDEPTQEEMDLQERLGDDQRCPFVLPEYWNTRRPNGRKRELYWCSIDLEKFYPTLNLDLIRQNIIEQIPAQWGEDATRLLETMLRFRLDVREWNDADLKKMDLSARRRTFRHLPTGLYVAGFLANAALLKVDLAAAKLLARRKVAHFRFVDDHIVLAFTIKDLQEWVNQYAKLLDDSGSGAHINLKKVEPNELSCLISGNKHGRGQKHAIKLESAREACYLDPQFPSPLMTKTLALISGIARIDFNLLETDELAALTDQLEHLLLVDLSEEELPEKTRLSFAAMRLTRVAECRLANDESMTALRRQNEALQADLDLNNLTVEARRKLKQQTKDVTRRIREEDERLKHEGRRAFQLLRKVLRERPDTIRLWTRAVFMCRRAGVKGLAELIGDIAKEKDRNPLAAEYLRANMLAVVGSQALIAARILGKEGEPDWRRQAARAFLQDVRQSRMPAPDEEKDHQFLRMSWDRYCFGLYCSDLVLQGNAIPARFLPYPNMHESLLKIGRLCGETAGMEHTQAQWAWWAARMTLRDLAPHADGLVRMLGQALRQAKQAAAFWRFFPLDAPGWVLQSMTEEKNSPFRSDTVSGWWFDALRERPEVAKSLAGTVRRGTVTHVHRVMTLSREDTISLYEWCDRLQEMPRGGNTDPRNSEWTALEIVRQAGLLLAQEETLSVRYLQEAHRLKSRLPSVHPANFRVPKRWSMEKELTWGAWQSMIRPDGRSRGVLLASSGDRILDNRYTPLDSSSPLFTSINPVRGLGLLLYGLLRRNFDMPAVWNGPGHARLLGMLPRLLLADMICSSWTLGVLQGCLYPRAIENLFLKTATAVSVHSDDDTLHDPLVLVNANEVVSAIAKCQAILEEYQLSTLEHKARQLTPVNIDQLTKPDWSMAFTDPHT
jgi:hypothetical protein